MPYLAIKDFKFGMDRRRPQVTGIPGTLWKLANGIISRGGDVERFKKFVALHTLPSNTHGLHGVKGELYVFGSISPPTVPLGVAYQQLAAPSTPAMTDVLYTDSFDGNVYAIAEYDDGNIYHFYNGSRVTDWDALADANSSYAAVAIALARKITVSSSVSAEAFGVAVKVKAAVAGTAFSATSTATDNGSGTTPTATRSAVTANVVGVTEVVATGTIEVTGGTLSAGVNRISQVTVNSVNLLVSPVNWVSSHSATANALVVEINNNTTTSGYSATAVGAVVTISAAVGTGAAPNGYVVASTTAGDVTITDTNMAGGVAAVTAVAQVDKIVIAGASFDAVDMWEVTVAGVTYKCTGRAAGTGRSLFVQKGRVWSTARSLVQYCKLNDASNWNDGTSSTGSGFINISQTAQGALELVGIADYNGKAAIFSEDTIVLYQFDADSDNIVIDKPLKNTGTKAPRAVVPYGNSDVYYLDTTGIRSIRTRDGYDSAFVSDVGAALDTFIATEVATLSEDALARAPAVVDPDTGRYMLALDDRIIILSYFPSSKITAWSYADPGFSITELIRTGSRVYARSGATIYILGGEGNDTYPSANELNCVLETPFMDAKDPADIKDLNGVDMALSNDWLVEILVDPNDTTKLVTAGVINKTTYNLDQIKIPGRTALVAFRLTCSAAGAATVSNVAIHFNEGETG